MSDKHIAHFDHHHHNKDDDKSDCLYFDAKDIIYSNLDIIIIMVASFYLLNKNLEKHENEHAYHNVHNTHDVYYFIFDSRSVSHREVSRRSENLFLRQNV
jgi:hypothetical protein